MKGGAYGEITAYDMVHMANAICDADPSLEDSKHGHRCVRAGCLVPRDICVAWSQARAAIEALGLVWQPSIAAELKLQRLIDSASGRGRR